MTCSVPGCGREARYVGDLGLTCALCPLIAGADSVRFCDVRDLLPILRDLLACLDQQKTSAGLSARQDIKAILGRHTGAKQ